jgi:hypothetical protein
VGIVDADAIAVEDGKAEAEPESSALLLVLVVAAVAAVVAAAAAAAVLLLLLLLLPRSSLSFNSLCSIDTNDRNGLSGGSSSAALCRCLYL